MKFQCEKCGHKNQGVTEKIPPTSLKSVSYKSSINDLLDRFGPMTAVAISMPLQISEQKAVRLLKEHAGVLWSPSKKGKKVLWTAVDSKEVAGGDPL